MKYMYLTEYGEIYRAFYAGIEKEKDIPMTRWLKPRSKKDMVLFQHITGGMIAISKKAWHESNYYQLATWHGCEIRIDSVVKLTGREITEEAK